MGVVALMQRLGPLIARQRVPHRARPDGTLGDNALDAMQKLALRLVLTARNPALQPTLLDGENPPTGPQPHRPPDSVTLEASSHHERERHVVQVIAAEPATG